MKKAVTNLAVLKQRIVLAIMANCLAGGSRRRNMITLAKQIGADGNSDLEKSLREYVQKKIDMRHANRLLIWMITKATYMDEIARPPICIPKMHSDDEVMV